MIQKSPPFVSSIAIAIVLLSGCASQPPAITSSNADPSASAASSTARYTLSATEAGLSCKELTGRMQLRILELRDYNALQETSAVSRALQSTIGSLFGAPAPKDQPAPDNVNDRARLDAYNRRLAELNCKTYNLTNDLKPNGVMITPTPQTDPGKAAAR